MVEIAGKLVCPRAPTFITVEVPGLVLGRGGELPKVRTADLTAVQKDELARQWRAALDRAPRDDAV
jgi:hypothetical protein